MRWSLLRSLDKNAAADIFEMPAQSGIETTLLVDFPDLEPEDIRADLHLAA